jgi:AcrR family transcriptional regulator
VSIRPRKLFAKQTSCAIAPFRLAGLDYNPNMNSDSCLVGTIPPRQERSRATQAALIDALEGLLLEKAYDNISIADIARKAGVGVASFYTRFRDKDALLRELLENHETRRDSDLAAKLEPSEWWELAVEQRAEKLVSLLVAHYTSRRGVVRAYIDTYRAAPAMFGTAQRSQLLSVYSRAAQCLAGSSGNLDVAREAVYMISACCRDFIVYGGDPFTESIGLTVDSLQSALTASVAQFLVSKGIR